MSKHEQMLEASIHFWILKEEKRIYEPVNEPHLIAKEKPRDCSAEPSKNN